MALIEGQQLASQMAELLFIRASAPTLFRRRIMRWIWFICLGEFFWHISGQHSKNDFFLLCTKTTSSWHFWRLGNRCGQQPINMDAIWMGPTMANLMLTSKTGTILTSEKSKSSVASCLANSIFWCHRCLPPSSQNIPFTIFLKSTWTRNLKICHNVALDRLHILTGNDVISYFRPSANSDKLRRFRLTSVAISQ